MNTPLHHGSKRGQSSVEVMLMIAVIVIAVVAAGYALADIIVPGLQSLGDGASTAWSSGPS